MNTIRSCVVPICSFLLFACLSASAATAPGITLSVPANPVTINNPGQYNLDVTIMPRNGFTGSLSTACALIQSPQGARNLPTCQDGVLVATIPTISGPNSVMFPLTILTAAMVEEQIPGTMTGDSHVPWLPLSGGVLACAFCIFFPKKKKRWTLLLIPLLAAVSLGLLGCGGNKNLTTPGSYTFGITATAAGNNPVSASTTFTVIVQ